MSGNFKIEGIIYPGRVALFKMGEVRLHELPDEVLLDIHKKGLCDYVKLTNEGYAKYFPKKAPIEVKEPDMEKPKGKEKTPAKKNSSSTS